MTFLIVAGAIKCLICERISRSAADVDDRYCPNCAMFHDDLERVDAALRSPTIPPAEAALLEKLFGPHPTGADPLPLERSDG
jgi:hypothetical protein